MSIAAALILSEERKMDLVEISPESKVCKILDYKKMQYEQSRKDKLNIKNSKMNSKSSILKEIKMKPGIGKHDYQTKLNQTQKFLEEGYSVKVSAVLFGRMKLHPETAKDLITQIMKDFENFAIMEKDYSSSDFGCFIVLKPKK